MTSEDLERTLLDLAENLRWARFRRSLTQTEAAAQIGIHYSALSRMERGKLSMTVDTLQRAVAWLEIGPVKP